MSKNNHLSSVAQDEYIGRRASEADITEEDVAYQESLELPEPPPFVVLLGASLNLH